MTQGIFIAGTDTGVGKTRITVGLLTALGLRGRRACGMKPVATGINALLNPADFVRFDAHSSMLGDDGAEIAAVSSKVFLPEDLCCYRFLPPISPHIAADRAGVRIDLDRIAAAYDRIRARCEWVLVEGTGGWYAPISERATMADVALRLGLPVLLVVGVRLGCLNHAQLSREAIERTRLPFAGWIANVLDASLDGLGDNIATLSARLQAPPWAVLPHNPKRDQDVEHLQGALDSLLAS